MLDFEQATENSKAPNILSVSVMATAVILCFLQLFIISGNRNAPSERE
jgi:hypothetical protein